MTPLLSRLAALALALALPGALVFGVALPVHWHLAAQDEEIADLAAQLDRFTERLASMQAERPVTIAETALIEAPSLEVAAAALQDIVAAAVRDAGGEISSLRAGRAVPLDAQGRESPEADSVVRRLPVSAELTIDVTGLQEFLYIVETHRPYLVVDRLEARRQPPRGDEVASRVSLRLDVSGFTAPGD